jgi:hypothetical protein
MADNVWRVGTLTDIANVLFAYPHVLPWNLPGWRQLKIAEFCISVGQGTNRRATLGYHCLSQDPVSGMQRFYLHIKDGDVLYPDEEGLDLPDVEDAEKEALHCARELLADAIKAGKPRVPEALVIADETGHTVAFVPLIALLPEPLRGG